MVINIFFILLLLVPLAASADQGSVLANNRTDKTFCVAKENADKNMLQAALDWTCGPGKVNCSMLLQGEPCYEPHTVVAHASYAFHAYYHQMHMAKGTCDFNGVATITTTDPSRGDCIFPRSNGTVKNCTLTLVPSTNSTTSGSSSLLLHTVSFSRLVVGLLWSVAFL